LEKPERHDMKSKMKAHTRAYQIVILLSDSPSPQLFGKEENGRNVKELGDR